MITVGSISREDATDAFPFLAESYPGRRTAIRDLTHRDPEFVFWIFQNGKLHDAVRSHCDNVPKGYEYILKDEPDYGGLLRGRVVRSQGRQLIVVYCRSETLLHAGPKLNQFLDGVGKIPVPIDDDALVISDNADIFGILSDLYERAA